MGARPRAQLALAIAAAVGTLFGVQGISAALPVVERELGVSESELGLFTAIYMLPAVIFAVPLGYAADKLGRRRVFVSMVVLYSLAGAAQAWTTDFGVILGLRFLQGVGFGGLMPLTVTLIGDAYRGAAQLRAQAHRQVAMGVGEFAMPLVGAALAAISWKTALLAQGSLLPVALAGALLLDDTRSRTASGGYARELAAAVRQPGLPAVFAGGFLRFVCKFALIAYLPLMLVGDRGATLAQGALVLGVASGVAAAVNFAVVRLLRRMPASRLLIGATALVGASVVGFALAPTWEVALAVAVLFGVGDGVLVVVQNSLVTEAAPDRIRAGVVAVSGMTRNAGKLASPLAMGALILVVSVPASFAVVGAATLAAVPALRPLRRLDRLLTRQRV
jgi:MFS transporter, ACDE family, multidrug resistance protein